jgi:hypothetical protein
MTTTAHKPAADAPPLSAADWLSLAAAPTFATMALLTAVFDGTSPPLCSAVSYALPMGGMVPMYMLMAVFHSAPWLRLIAGWRANAG